MLAATQALIAAARDPASAEAEVHAAVKAFFDALRKASREEAQAALRMFSGHFGLENAARGALLAVVCGAMVEGGCDPEVIAGPLTERIAGLLESSARLAEACVARSPQRGHEDADPSEAFEQAREQLAAEMPEEHAAWQALEQFWPPAVAVFSVSAAARAAARPLRSRAGQIAEHHAAGHWLHMMLGVLDDEPFLAIEPATRLGILGRMSGIVDNFQLNTLLMDGFPRPGFLARRRVSRRVADVARGIGPQQTDDTVTSVWNLYTWQAIQPDGTLPDPGNTDAAQFWIWNEGAPEDIPVFESRRVILIGPPSYPRSWRSQRMFGGLKASLDVERKLSKEEVAGWLKRMVEGKEASS